MTNLLSNIPGKQKMTFFDIVGDLTDRLIRTDCDLRIPKNAETAKETCTLGKKSLYEKCIYCIQNLTSYIPSEFFG